MERGRARGLHGIALTGNADLTSTSVGSVTLSGNVVSSAAGATSYGVLVDGAGTTVSVAGGNLTVTGNAAQAGGTSANVLGVYANNAAAVQTTGVGNIAITGVGGNSSGLNQSGIVIDNERTSRASRRRLGRGRSR